MKCLTPTTQHNSVACQQPDRIFSAHFVWEFRLHIEPGGLGVEDDGV